MFVLFVFPFFLAASCVDIVLCFCVRGSLGDVILCVSCVQASVRLFVCDVLLCVLLLFLPLVVLVRVCL